MPRGSVRVSRNFSLRLAPLTPALAREIGLWLAAQIENRTNSGLDENRRKFKPYSPDYLRRIKQGQSTVTLQKSGSMLAALDVLIATPNRIALGFRDAAMAQRAEYHDSLEPRAKMPLRRFMGLQQSWVDEAVRRIAKGIKFT